MIVYYIAALILTISPAAQGHVDYQPQQVHIALGGNLPIYKHNSGLKC